MLARAADLGVAMQLTNIARDVGEDAAMGRVYLPAEWLREEGLETAEFLGQPRYSDALARVVERLLEVAASLYQRADSGISKLPRACRPSMFAARLLYAEIGKVVAENGHDSVSSRAITSAPRKFRLLLQLPRVYALSRSRIGLPPLDETAFLVDAAIAMPAPATTQDADGLLDSLEGQFVWVLDLFEELHRRETRSGELAQANKTAGGS